MKRIEGIRHQLLIAQLIEACRVVVDGRAEIASIIIAEGDFKALEKALRAFSVTYRNYSLTGAIMVVIAKGPATLDQLEEVSQAPISRELKNRYLENILGLKLK